MKTVRKPHRLTSLLVVVGSAALFLAAFLYFWTEVKGPLPSFGEDDHYRVSFSAPTVKNLREGGDVTIAGVVVGSVTKLALEQDRALVTMELSEEAAPLHQGATARIGVKGATGTSNVEIVDGDGPQIADGATLPKSDVKEAVDVDELLAALGPETRKELRGTLRSLGLATDGTAGDMSRLMTGMGKLGREGYTALDAIAAQSGNLKALTREATMLLNALDTGSGQIAQLVRDGARLTQATAGQRSALEETMRALPAMLGTTQTATGKLGTLSESLSPVAADLKRSAPALNHALLQLPSVTRDLRGLMPALGGTLDAAPATLDRVPTFGTDVRQLVPGAQAVLRDINPMLAYLKPYGRDVGGMLASFGASMDVVSENGVRPIRITAIFNSTTPRNSPLPLTLDPTHWTNPYPAPGQAGNPGPFEGEYPRVEREPK